MTDLSHPDDVEADELELLVNGTTWRGWRSLSVSRSLEQAAGQFQVETRTGSLEPLPIRPGDEVVARLSGGVNLVTGVVDTLEGSSDGQRRSITLAGRDRTAQLVDCSAPAEPGEYKELDLEELARSLAEPFGVTVVREVDSLALGARFPSFKLQHGEKAWAAIERACRLRGILAHSDGEGRLVLSRPGAELAAVELVEGENVLASTFRYTLADRFSLYTVKGQGSGSDASWGETVAAVEGNATDPEIELFRPLLVLAEGRVTFSSAEDRAQWEATVRAARAAQVGVSVQGWRQGDPRERGPAWQVNQRVPVRIPSLGIKRELLVQAIQFSRGLDGGTLGQLTLVRRDAYQPQPAVDTGENPFGEILGTAGYGQGFELEEG